MFVLDSKENETLLGKYPASHIKKLLFIPQPNPGNLIVTDKRIVFEVTQGSPDAEFEYSVEEILSFSVGMANTLTITTKNGSEHKVSGMANKKLIDCLQQAGVKKSS